MLEKVFNEKFPKWLKILCLILGGGSVVYRAFIFADSCIDKKEKKETTALILAIIGAVLFPFAIVMMIFDIIDVCKGKTISWLCNLEIVKDEEAKEETKEETKEEAPVEAEVVETEEKKAE